MTAFGIFFEESIDALRAATDDETLQQAVEAAIALCLQAIDADAPILVCGNGGSACDADHLAAELVGRFRHDRRALSAISLASNAAVLTAWSNDHDFDSVFARQVEALARPGSVLIAISTSGNSRNTIAAAVAARRIGLPVVALTGATGGILRNDADVLLGVPARDTAIIQQVHRVLYHYICSEIETRSRIDPRVPRRLRAEKQKGRS